jgi:hypothetical protein
MTKSHRPALAFTLAAVLAAPGCDPNPTAPTAPSSADASKSPPADAKGKGAGAATTAARPID